MKNWKTTAAGLSTAFFGFVLFAPDYFKDLPWLVDVAKFGAAGGLAALGWHATDKAKPAK